MGLRMNFFRVPRHRKYEYLPRYYDADKAELEERLKKAELMAQDNIEGTKARIAHKLSTRSGNGRSFEPQRRKAIIRSNIRLLLILIFLIVLCLFLWDMYMPEIIDMLE